MNEDILAQLGQGQPAPAEEPKAEIKYADKKKSTGKQIDEDTLQELLMNGDNTKGMITPSEKERKKSNDDEELHEDPDEKAKLKNAGSARPSEKYSTEFQKDMMKNPDKYFINTPRGKMTIKEAMEQGYDPVTHRFNLKEKREKFLDNELKDLNDADKAAIKKLLDPKQVGLAPADAEQMGIDPTNPTIKREEPVPAEPVAPVPQGQPMPAAPAQPADIASLLGGGQ
jgi:hypothetical protein